MQIRNSRVGCFTMRLMLNPAQYFTVSCVLLVHSLQTDIELYRRLSGKASLQQQRWSAKKQMKIGKNRLL